MRERRLCLRCLRSFEPKLLIRVRRTRFYSTYSTVMFATIPPSAVLSSKMADIFDSWIFFPWIRPSNTRGCVAWRILRRRIAEKRRYRYRFRSAQITLSFEFFKNVDKSRQIELILLIFIRYSNVVQCIRRNGIKFECGSEETDRRSENKNPFNMKNLFEFTLQ